MIGLDTNILVRYLTQDHPLHSAKATEILERRLTGKNPGFVSVVAMVETVWVFDRAYLLTAQEIATAIERLLQVEVSDRKRAGSLHCYGCSKARARIVCGCADCRTRHARGVYSLQPRLLLTTAARVALGAARAKRKTTVGRRVEFVRLNMRNHLPMRCLRNRSRLTTSSKTRICSRFQRHIVIPRAIALNSSTRIKTGVQPGRFGHRVARRVALIPGSNWKFSI